VLEATAGRNLLSRNPLRGFKMLSPDRGTGVKCVLIWQEDLMLAPQEFDQFFGFFLNSATV
jgi:hypothetical protein